MEKSELFGIPFWKPNEIIYLKSRGK